MRVSMVCGIALGCLLMGTLCLVNAGEGQPRARRDRRRPTSTSRGRRAAQNRPETTAQNTTIISVSMMETAMSSPPPLPASEPVQAVPAPPPSFRAGGSGSPEGSRPAVQGAPMPTAPRPSPAEPPLSGIPDTTPAPAPTAVPPVAEPPRPSPNSLPAEGDLRIVDRLERNGFVSGALQVFVDGAFGAVCTSSFDPVDADVACRQLGFLGGTALPLAVDRRYSVTAPPEEVIAPFVLENPSCTGSEERLVDCPVAEDDYVYTYTLEIDFDYYVDRVKQCNVDFATYAYVACGTITEQEPGDLRLSNAVTSDSGNAQYGRLQAFYSGGWGSVCDPRPPHIDTTNADQGDQEIEQPTVEVACRWLGFSSGVKTALPLDTMSREERRVPIMLGGVTCEGGEDNLLSCPGAVLGEGSNRCGIREAVAVICFNELDASLEGSLRIEGGDVTPEAVYGRLQIFLNGFWGDICSTESFTPDAAQVACKVLGYDGGAQLPRFNEHIIRNELTGDYESETASPDNPPPIMLANVDCGDNDSSLLQCSSSPPDFRDCVRDSSVFGTRLACTNAVETCPPQPAPSQGSVRLRGGFGTPCDQIHTGFVEIFNRGEWGAVCSTYNPSRSLTASVVCRQMGFPYGLYMDPSVNPAGADEDILEYDALFENFALTDAEEADEPQERFWLARAICNGREEQLLDCRLGDGFLDEDAEYQECPPEFSVRLTVACRMFPVNGIV